MICELPVKSWYIYLETKSTGKSFPLTGKKRKNFEYLPKTFPRDLHLKFL